MIRLGNGEDQRTEVGVSLEELPSPRPRDEASPSQSHLRLRRHRLRDNAVQCTRLAKTLQHKALAAPCFTRSRSLFFRDLRDVSDSKQIL